VRDHGFIGPNRRSHLNVPKCVASVIREWRGEITCSGTHYYPAKLLSATPSDCRD